MIWIYWLLNETIFETILQQFNLHQTQLSMKEKCGQLNDKQREVSRTQRRKMKKQSFLSKKNITYQAQIL